MGLELSCSVAAVARGAGILFGDAECVSLVRWGLILISGENRPPIGDGGDAGRRAGRIGGVSGRYGGVGGADGVWPIARGGWYAIVRRMQQFGCGGRLASSGDVSFDVGWRSRFLGAW